MGIFHGPRAMTSSRLATWACAEAGFPFRTCHRPEGVMPSGMVSGGVLGGGGDMQTLVCLADDEESWARAAKQWRTGDGLRWPLRVIPSHAVPCYAGVCVSQDNPTHLKPWLSVVLLSREDGSAMCCRGGGPCLTSPITSAALQTCRRSKRLDRGSRED